MVLLFLCVGLGNKQKQHDIKERDKVMKTTTTTIMILVLATLVISARGGAISWDGSEGEAWGTAGNWNNGVPGSGDSAYLGLNGVGCPAVDTTAISGGYDASVINTFIGWGGGYTMTLNVSGSGSTLTTSGTLYVSAVGNGRLNVTSGAEVSVGALAYSATDSSTVSGYITVDGAGSKLLYNAGFSLAYRGISTLTISDEGLVAVGGTMTMAANATGVALVQMKTGGQLALEGSANNLTGFYGLISGTDNEEFQYWTGSAWSDLANGTKGTDYGFTAGSGDLSGYTVLTVPALPPGGTIILVL